MGLTVRRTTNQVERWDAIPGETRWVDYGAHQEAGELVVYLYAFRRVRERFDRARDALLWKPATTKVAHRYSDGEWAEVQDEKREWPLPGVEYVGRRHHGPHDLEDKARRRRR